MWDGLRQDIAFGARMLRRQPGFTAVALLALALGIGATTAIFSVVDAVLWRPLPYPRADRVMSLAEQRPRESRWFGPIAPADFFDWRRDNSLVFGDGGLRRSSPSSAYNLTGDGEPERVRPLEVTPSFLGVIGMTPALGRDFRAEEETVGRHRVALLSDGLWRRRFGADPSDRRPDGRVRWANRTRSSACCRRDSGGRRVRTSSSRSRCPTTIARCAPRISSRRSAGCVTACRPTTHVRICGSSARGCRRSFPPKTRTTRRICGRCTTRLSATCRRCCWWCWARSRSCC